MSKFDAFYNNLFKENNPATPMTNIQSGGTGLGQTGTTGQTGSTGATGSVQPVQQPAPVKSNIDVNTIKTLDDLVKSFNDNKSVIDTNTLQVALQKLAQQK